MVLSNMIIRKTVPLDLTISIKSFYLLMKPRVMSLAIFTCTVGLIISNSNINITDAIIGIFLVALGAGAAGCLNMWYESDLDALMSRTCLRPIPTGKVNRNQALVFGIVLSVISVGALNYFSNFLSASLLLFTIFFYLFIYTIWLKRKTPQNIVIGGAAGALPPVIGWTIATNAITLEPLILFLIIFFWTPSHFWALSLYKINDYKKVKIPMLPITAGIKKTKLNILIYSLLMAPIVALPYFFNFGSLIYLILSSSITFYYVYLCFLLFKEKNNKVSNIIAKKIFVYSIFYLFFIFVLILFDNLIQY